MRHIFASHNQTKHTEMNKEKHQSIERLCEQVSREGFIEMSISQETRFVTTLIVAVNPELGEQFELAEDIAEATAQEICAEYNLKATAFGWNDDYSIICQLNG